MEDDQTEQDRNERTNQAMRDAGVATETMVQVDYFGFDETFRVDLPDGQSWIEHQVLNEGARRKYMNETNREVRLQKTGDAFMKMATGDERHALLESSIVGWNLVRSDKKDGEIKPLVFNPTNLRNFLTAAPPTIVDLIEKDIRDRNPWLVGDVTIEDIDQQIEELNELRDKKVAEAEGKES